MVLDYCGNNVCQESLEQSILSDWIVTSRFYLSNCRPFIFENTGKPYNVSRITTEDATLDSEKYRNYSPLLQGPRIALAYALSFASIACVLVNAALYDGKNLISRFRFGKDPSKDDAHMREMRKYSEVPEWWYLVLFLVLFAISMASVVAWPTFLPWWGFILTILLPIIFILPIGMIQARTSQQVGLNVITEFIAGYIWPGKPVANTLVKIYGYMTMSRGLCFVGDLKLGIYMKVPPRAMFRFQLVGSFLSNITALGSLAASTATLILLVVITSLIKSVPDLCDPKSRQGFTCPGLNVFYRATVIWGVHFLSCFPFNASLSALGESSHPAPLMGTLCGIFSLEHLHRSHFSS